MFKVMQFAFHELNIIRTTGSQLVVNSLTKLAFMMFYVGHSLFLLTWSQWESSVVLLLSKPDLKIETVWVPHLVYTLYLQIFNKMKSGVSRSFSLWLRPLHMAVILDAGGKVG